MPRDGSGIWTKPFPDVVPGTTIESTVYNGFVADVEQDLNAPRPIIAGGTGASNAADALFNLGGEQAAQLVTNFDSHMWYPGSWRSSASATGGPFDGHAFAGIVYINEAIALPPTNANLVVEARDLDDTQSPGIVYVREKKANVWGAWTFEGASTYVAKAGDVMTGNLKITGTAPNLTLNTTDVNAPTVFGNANDKSMWLVQLGATAGRNFYITRCDDAGAVLGNAMVIDRATGTTVVENFACSAVNTGFGTTSGTIYFGNSGTKTLAYDGTAYTLTGGTFTVDGAIISTANIAAGGGTLFLHSDGTKYLSYGGTDYVFNGSSAVRSGGDLSAVGTIRAGSAGASGTYYFGNDATRYLYCDGAFPGTYVFGTGGVSTSGLLYAAEMQTPNITATVQGYKPGGGDWAATSDARIKNELGDYTRGLADIAQLRPVFYTYKGNDTPVAPAHIEVKDPNKTVTPNTAPPVVPYPNSMHVDVAKAGTKFAGLIAQEVEAIFPEMVTQTSGYIDGVAVTDMRNLDTTPLIFALINAVKELKAEVEALKAP